MASSSSSRAEEEDSCCRQEPSRDLYLTPDERYEVWVVKAAERPELLLAFAEDEKTKDGAEDSRNPCPAAAPSALQDGCDVAGMEKGEPNGM